MPTMGLWSGAVAGRLEQAKKWLEEAFRFAGNPRKMKLAALDDPDLRPPWKESGSV